MMTEPRRCPSPEPVRRPVAPLDLWIRRELAGRYDAALSEPLPEALLALLVPPAAH